MRFVVLILSLCALAVAPHAQAPQPQRDRHVILISLDGFPAVAMDNPRTPVPTLHRLAREGARGAAIIPVNPVVTWPNHTTYVTGVLPAVHQVMFNGLLVRNPNGVPTIEPWRPKREMVKAQTVYDAAHAAGLSTAEVDWVAIHQPKTISWAFPERPNPDGQVERELIARGSVTADDIATFNRGTPAAWRDQVWTDAAIHILETHKPNLLLFHLLALDSTHHTYGVGGLASATGMAFVDAQVGRLMAALERSGLAAKTTVIVLADHGFRNARRSINPNVVLRQAGLIRGEGEARQADAWTMPWGGTAGIYLRDRSQRDTLLRKMESALTGLEGVDGIFTGPRLTELGLPDPAASDQAPDLVLSSTDGYEFGRADTGEVVTDIAQGVHGHHGVLNTDPSMRALFVAWGRDVKPGAMIGDVRAIDVAPTIAEWLGVALPGAVGRSLAATLAGR
jgi:predicted AlkP superfamily pyrophosphatase or phosphodiesterase